ncbi:MAG: hypothetical protein QOG68_761 [Solirubrobacteraceae bacterium]|nr:hypothetical protein [Solirubrobacteraceae bacterium]
MATVEVGLEELEHLGRPREAGGLSTRELRVEGAAAALFLAAAIVLAVAGSTGRPARLDVAVALAVAFAVAVRARFDIGAGYVPPTQLVFVPALFLEPPRLVPLIVLAGWLLGRLPDLLRSDLHVSRLMIVPGNCWFAIGPALVLTLADAGAPSWGDWPLYVLALAAQFAGDLGSGLVRDRLILGLTPEIELRSLAYVWLIDLALSPIGLLAAFASQDNRFAFLGVLPLALLFVIFSNERTRRFEAELSSTRAREALIAGASHELQTPLSVLSGLVDTLARSPHLSPERRSASYQAMRRQTAHLRHLVGLFVDYARMKAGQELLINPRPTEIGPLLRSVAELWGDAELSVDAGDVAAVVDAARLHAVVMTLVSNAIRHGPPLGPVLLSARSDGRRVMIEVTDQGPGLPENRLEAVFDEFEAAVERTEGSGLGLFLARTGLRAQRGDVRLANGPGGGLVATIYLPAAPR